MERTPPDAAGRADAGYLRTQVESRRIAVGEDHFCATLVAPSRAQPAVIFVHGWNGSQEMELAHVRDAAVLGCAVLAVDLRGHDRDDARHDRVTREDNLRDLVAAYDWMVARKDVDERAVAVVGFSYGAYLAAILTSLRRVQWLALRSPALYPDDGWNLPKHELDRHLPLDDYRRSVRASRDDRALRACVEFRGDVLLVASQCDEVLPPQVGASYAAALVGANSITTRVIDGADHELSTPDARRAWAELLQGWLRDMIAGARRLAVVSGLEARHERIDGADDPHRHD